jgi:hypothetical protein
LLSGLFYLLGLQQGAPVTQKCLWSVLDSSEHSIRKSTEAWIKNFPEFFPDFEIKEEDSGYVGCNITRTYFRGKLANHVVDEFQRRAKKEASVS